MREDSVQKAMSLVVFLTLLVVSFFLLQPILMSIIIGMILAFIFFPLYRFGVRLFRSEAGSALFMCGLLLIAMVLPIWFLTPVLIDQSLQIYFSAQNVDYATPLQTLFPQLFSSEDFTYMAADAIHSFVTQTANKLANSFTNLILNLPIILLHLAVIFFVFFFVLKDSDELVNYIKSLLPFPKEVQRKFFENTKGITISVLYGQVVVGVFQGLLVGIAFFVFGVPNGLFLTLLAILAGVFPIIGTTIIWLPVAIFLAVSGNYFAAIGITLVGVISTNLDNILRPLIVARRTNIHSSVVLIGMVGGFFLFGIMGFIVGPLVLAYLLIVLELYRDKSQPSLFLENPN